MACAVIAVTGIVEVKLHLHNNMYSCLCLTICVCCLLSQQLCQQLQGCLPAVPAAAWIFSQLAALSICDFCNC